MGVYNLGTHFFHGGTEAFPNAPAPFVYRRHSKELYGFQNATARTVTA